MSTGVFVTGTDTGVGKTHVAASLLAALNAMGVVSIGMKPVASGCVETPRGLRNDDALTLIAHSAGGPDYANVNPFAFRDPIAPHIAAGDNGVEVAVRPIGVAFATLSTNADCVIVEGVGGWCAPLSGSLMQSDLVRALDARVILTIGLRLGCINHALLTARAIVTDGCELIGWIGNRIDPDMLRTDDNITTLRELIAAPCLGILPFSKDRDARHNGAHLNDAVTALSDACRRAP